MLFLHILDRGNSNKRRIDRWLFLEEIVIMISRRLSSAAADATMDAEMWDPQAQGDARGQQDPEDARAPRVPKALRVCRVCRGLLDLRDPRVCLDPPVLRDLEGSRVIPAYLELRDPPERRERQVPPAPRA